MCCWNTPIICCLKSLAFTFECSLGIVSCVAGSNHIFCIDQKSNICFFSLFCLVQKRKCSWLNNLHFCCLRFESPKFAGSTPKYLSDYRQNLLIFFFAGQINKSIDWSFPFCVCRWTPHFKGKAQSRRRYLQLPIQWDREWQPIASKILQCGAPRHFNLVSNQHLTILVRSYEYHEP